MPDIRAVALARLGLLPAQASAMTATSPSPAAGKVKSTLVIDEEVAERRAVAIIET